MSTNESGSAHLCGFTWLVLSFTKAITVEAAIRTLIRSFSRGEGERLRIIFLGARARLRLKSIISAGCTSVSLGFSYERL